MRDTRIDISRGYEELSTLAADGEGITYSKLGDAIVTRPAPPDFAFGPIDKVIGHFYYGQRLCREVGLYRIQMGCLLGDGLIAHHGKLVRCVELGLYEDSISTLFGPFRNGEPLKVRFEAGSLVAIAGLAHHIYGHWLIDHLPKLWVLQQSGIEIDADPIRFLLPRSLRSFARQWLSLLGIPDERLVFYDPLSEIVMAEELLLPTMVRFESVASPLLRQVSDMLLERIAVHGGLPGYADNDLPDRIYVSRAQMPGTARPMKNRRSVESLATAAGFTIIYPERLPIAEQVALFRGARQIVGEYGSGLHNSLFSSDGTVVAALRGSAVNPHFLQSGIGRALKQPTGYVFGHTDPEDPMMSYSVDEEDFADCLRLIFPPNVSSSSI